MKYIIQNNLNYCFNYSLIVKAFTQLTFTCLKSTIETPEKDVKYVPS